jgi:hypothetical protein
VHPTLVKKLNLANALCDTLLLLLLLLLLLP